MEFNMRAAQALGFSESAAAQFADLVDLTVTISREVLQQIRYDGIVKLSGTEVAVVRYISEHEDASPSEIATALNLLRSNVSPALRNLQEYDMIERFKSGRDVRLRATSTALAHLQRIRHEWSCVVGSALGESHLDLADTLSVLRHVDRALVDYRNRPFEAENIS